MAFLVTFAPTRTYRRALLEADLPGLPVTSDAAADSHGGGGALAVTEATAVAVPAATAAATPLPVSTATASESIGSEAEPLEEQLPGRAGCIVNASTMTAPVHGWIVKAGALPMRLLDGPQTLARHQAYFKWRDSGNLSLLMQQATVNGQIASVGRAPPLFPYCRVLVNHAYRTLYLKAPKTGSTSLLTLMGTCTGAATDKATCFEPLKPLKSKEQYEALYRDYFVFTVVRNPWTRAVSSYRMLARYTSNTCADIVGGWNRVCADLNHLGRLHNRHPECTLSKQQGEGFAMHHLIPQAPCLVTEGGEWAADYVVRMESMQEDMGEVLQQMEKRRAADAPPLDVPGLLSKLRNVNRVHVACRGGLITQTTALTSQRRRRRLAAAAVAVDSNGKKVPNWLEASESYCNDAQYYIGPHSACFDALKAYYAQDVALFGLPQCTDPPF
ncbi:hypothetical protein D9Q98_003951 [Chlorella vulgaris]|uniref:Sulfotransferase n=1 Tax=Chlorella vulgaris TaxID=3077 RepID=A0A9D4TQZ6_CHLVU|nr:hypothetical protein D9Q98_003951 [Chlorella vulgaris]